MAMAPELANCARRATLNGKSAMSIIAAAVRSGPTAGLLMGLITIVATLLAIAVFIASGAWRPGSIRGPKRLPPDEPISPLVFIMAGGVSLWLFVPVLILK